MNRIKINDNLSDFKNILNTFKQKILIISIFTLIVFVLVFYVGSQVNKNASFKAKTLIDGSKININLNAINNFENIFNSFLIKRTGGKIEKINYLDVFLSTLNKNVIVEILDKNSFINKNDYVNKEDYKNDLSEIYDQNFNLGVEKKLIFEDKINNSLWYVEFSGPFEKKKIWSETLRELKLATTDAFKQKIMEIFKAKLEVINVIIGNDQKMIALEIDYLLNEDFEYKNNAILIYLKEQAAIARALQVENGLEYLFNVFQGKKGIINNLRGEDFLSFQWGYLPIERKIDEIIARKKSDAKYYVKEYQGLSNKNIILEREKLYYEKIYENLEKNLAFFEDTDLETDYLNVNTTQFSSNQFTTTQLILISLIISLLVNTIFLALSIIYKNNSRI